MAYTKPIRTNTSNSFTRNGAQMRLYGNENFVYVGSQSGEKVYGWRSKIKAGVDATSPYTLDRVFEQGRSEHSFTIVRELIGNWPTNPYVIYSDQFAFNGFYPDISSYGQAYFGHVAGIPSNAEAEALARLYSKIREESYGVNGLLVIGELRETIQMLRNPLAAANKATQLYLDALKAKRREIKQSVPRRRSETDRQHSIRRANALKNAMAGSWLELQFGLLPAISDAKEILEESLDMYLKRARNTRTRLRARSPKFSNVIQDEGLSFYFTNLQFKVSYRRETEASVQYTCGVNRTLVSPVGQMEDALQRFGFQIQNFVPTIYELIPWSFLVDYFVNLGDIVEAVCTDTSNVTWVSRTQRQDTLITHTSEGVPYNEGSPGTVWRVRSFSGNSGDQRIFRHITVQRTKPGGLPIPPLVFSIPGSDSKKWFNMAALLTQAKNFRF